jgi:putative ABC transport system permease protein
MPRPILWLEQVRQDARYAARVLSRNYAFSSVAILSLALGIGATTSVFSVVDHILFRSLPYAYGDRLVSLGMTTPALAYDFFFGAQYLAFRKHQQLFEAVTSWTGVNDCDVSDGERVRLTCAAIESSFLSTLGIVPVLGRSFTAPEDGPDRPKTLLLSYGIWRLRFGGRQDVLGRTVSLDGNPARVIGVLPRDFEVPTLAHVDLVIPQGLDEVILKRAITGRPLRVIARLRPGTQMAQIRAAADIAISNGLRDFIGSTSVEWKPRVRTLRDLETGDAKVVSWLLFGSVVAVLLLACANVANLLLARRLLLRRELAIRVAMGAGRLRLFRQSLTESLLLALLGGITGGILGYGLLKLFVRMAPAGIPRLAQATLDDRVLAFTFACCVVSALIFGSAPGFSTPEIDVLARSPGIAIGRGSLRHALIAAQFALSLALLAGAGLLGRALWTFQHVPLGMETQQVLNASFSLSQQKYPDIARQLAFSEELEDRLRSAPGILAAAIADSHPPRAPLRSKPIAALAIDGKPQEPPARGTVVWGAVTPDYFRVLRIPILRGRPFSEEDRNASRDVMVISEALAKRLFPNQNAIGHSIESSQIVGIAANVRNSGGTAPDDPEYYVPRSRKVGAFIYSYPDELRRASVIARTPLAPQAAAQVLRDAIAGLDSSLPVNIETLGESVARLSARPRFSATLFGLFALIGLALAAAGLYAALRFLVVQRTSEIGLRMALGATPAAILRAVLTNVGLWLGLGLIVGLALSLTVARLIHALLFGLSERDPIAWTLSAAVLLFAALAAAWFPLRHATSIDPMSALRHE